MSDGRKAKEEAVSEEASAPEAGEVHTGGESGGQEAAKSPDELRGEIEETREELGDTVDALAQKADVKAQVRRVADEQKAKARATQQRVRDRVSSVGGGRGGDAGEQAKTALANLSERASTQPLPYLGGAAAAGLVLGMLLRGRKKP
jgi:ElaB/YqjD/DUF883 family membrane-anchored ribosome-binding protein